MGKIYIFARNYGDAVAHARQKGLAEGQWMYIVAPAIIEGVENITFMKTKMHFRHDDAGAIDKILAEKQAREINAE